MNDDSPTVKILQIVAAALIILVIALDHTVNVIPTMEQAAGQQAENLAPAPASRGPGYE